MSLQLESKSRGIFKSSPDTQPIQCCPRRRLSVHSTEEDRTIAELYLHSVVHSMLMREVTCRRGEVVLVRWNCPLRATKAVITLPVTMHHVMELPHPPFLDHRHHVNYSSAACCTYRHHHFFESNLCSFSLCGHPPVPHSFMAPDTVAWRLWSQAGQSDHS